MQGQGRCIIQHLHANCYVTWPGIAGRRSISRLPGRASLPRAGELVSNKVTEWSFVAPVETIEMQLITDDNRSRTTWILDHGGFAYIPVTLGSPPGEAADYRRSEYDHSHDR
jgi:hypothetical protein